MSNTKTELTGLVEDLAKHLMNSVDVLEGCGVHCQECTFAEDMEREGEDPADIDHDCDTDQEECEREGMQCEECQTAYDIRGVVSFSQGKAVLLGLQFMVAGEGPNIWVDTHENEIRGYWGSDTATHYLNDATAQRLNEHWIDAMAETPTLAGRF